MLEIESWEVDAMGLPWYAELHLLLYRDEPGIYPEYGCCSCQHRKDPEVELELWPMVASPPLAVDYFSSGHCEVRGLGRS